MSTCSPKSVRQTAEIRTSNCGAPYVKLRSPVRQTAEPRTSNCGAPYVKLRSPVPQSTRPLDRHRRCRRSPRIGSPRRHCLPASEPTTEPGGWMPPGPGPVWWIRTVSPGRSGRRVRPVASARRIGAGPDGRALVIPGPSSGGSGVGSGRGGRGRRGPGRGRRTRGRWRRSRAANRARWAWASWCGRRACDCRPGAKPGPARGDGDRPTV